MHSWINTATMANNPEPAELVALSKLLQLAQFTGTTQYYRISPKHLLTDGTKYLADHGKCYWMMDAIISHLCEIGTQEWFVIVRMQVKKRIAVMIYEDGNGNELARQAIDYTDFPLEEIVVYASWDSEHWVILLPSEY